MSGSSTPTPTAGPAVREPTVGQLMRPATRTVEADAHVASAAYLMKRAHDCALVVTSDDEGRMPIAVLTDADVSQAVADGRDLGEIRINDLRLPRPMAVHPDTSLTEAAELMLDKAVSNLPVVDDAGLVGVVDLAAVCRALLRRQPAA
jgi:CBS domain-containing protein